MKKIALFLALVLCFCAVLPVLAEEHATPETAEYTVYNTTGGKVTELYIYPADAAEKGTNYAGRKGMANGDAVVITFDAAAKADKYTIEFKADGIDEPFTWSRLSFEVAPISLKLVDAASGATPLTFSTPAVYYMYNTTGATITELYIYPVGSADKGENYAGEGLAAGKSVNIVKEAAKGEDTAAITYTVEFKAEGMDTQTWDKLHYEIAPMSLKSVDAAAGATPLAFAATAEYTVYNTTGANVTELYVYAAGSEDKGENYAAAGMADGACVVVIKTEKSQAAAKAAVYVLEFKAEGMDTQSFDTLHHEVAPISLKSVDAAAGATAISFTAPEK